MTTIKWADLSLGKLFPEGAEDALKAVETTMEAIKVFLDILATALGILLAAAINGANLRAALIEIAREALRRLANIFTGTSVSYIGYCPRTIRDLKSPSQVLRIIGESRFDKADGERPIAITKDTGYVTIAFFATAPNIALVLSQYELIRALFTGSIEEIKRALERARRQRKAGSMYQEVGDFPFVNRGFPRTQPDWRTVRLSDIGVFAEFTNTLIGLEQKLGSSQLRLQAYIEMLELIGAKISSILAQIERFRALIDILLEVATLTSGVGCLVVTGLGDTEDQVGALIASRYAQDYPYTDYEACAVFMLHAQAGAVGTVQAIIDLITQGPPIDLSTISRPSVQARLLGYDRVSPDQAVRNPWGS
jgi:hypothetical protein